MAITTEIKKFTVKNMLNIGTSSTGVVRTYGVSIGALSPEGYTVGEGGVASGDAHAYAIAAALAPCLSNSTYRVERSGIVYLDEDE